MRTTVTLDYDVEHLLRQASHQSGQSFKATLNQAIRKGLAEIVPTIEEEPFVVRSQPMGLRPGIDPTKLQELDGQLEVEAFLHLARRLDRTNNDSH